jgi:hypothetical protein
MQRQPAVMDNILAPVKSAVLKRSADFLFPRGYRLAAPGRFIFSYVS